MDKRSIILLTALLGLVSLLSAQPGPGGDRTGQPAGTIAGQVFDEDLNVPIEYANIVVRSLRDSSQVTGGITDQNGRFELTGVRPGRFFVEVSFIGYRQRNLNSVQLAPGGRAELGRITLRQTAVAVSGVEATAERPRLSYQIDKKVVDVAHQPTPPTGTAVDALENVPSVKVDDDGNVTMRGSGSFKVLIDGRPSPLDGSDALQQIPASTIDNIEIITNPSAKYDPEGPAGIINVVLKKQRQSGTSGIVNLRGSTEGSYGGDFLLGWRNNGLNLFAGADFSRHSFPGERRTEAWTRDDSTGDTTFVNSTSTMRRGGYPFGARLGGDLQLGRSDRVGLNASIGRRAGGGVSTSADTEFVRPGGATRTYTAGDTSRRGGYYLALDADASHNFGRQGHDLVGRVEYRNRNMSEASSQYQESAGTVVSGQRTNEDGPNQRASLSLDYALPLREADKLEAGWRSGFSRGYDSTSTFYYNPATGAYDYAPDYSHVVAGADDVHALYATYTADFKPFGVQAGLRGESSVRSINVDRDSSIPVNATDLFPSLHASYSLGEQHQLMASYTRRIERPGHWQLQPFPVWWNPRLVRQGNPGLKPEYIDALELGWQVPLPIGRLTLEGYHRVTHNVIEELTSIYAPRVFLRSPANVGTSRATGGELVAYLMVARWLGFNLSADVYDYRLTGTANGADFSTSSFSWQGNANAEIKPLPDTRIQLFARYSGPSATAQGTEDGFLMTGASIRQQFFSRSLSLTLQARDLLASSAHGGSSGGDGYDFYTRFRFRRGLAPSFSLGLTWNFNNFRVDRRRMQSNGDEGDDSGEMMR